MKCETPDQTYMNSEYLHNQTTLEVPVETLVSADNEIQTIHVGNFTNLPSAHDVNLSPEETFIATRNQSGTYNVTVQKSNFDSETNENDITDTKPLIPDPIIRTLPNSRGSFHSKRGIIMYGKSRMIADIHTTISVREFKTQLNDTSDTISSMEIAPPTKVFMNALNTRGVNKLFANPGRRTSASLSKCYTRHLTMKQIQVQQTFSDLELPPLVFTAKVDQSKKKRIAQKRSCPKAKDSLKPVSKHLATAAEHLQGLNKVDQSEIKPIPQKRSRPEDKKSLKSVSEHPAPAADLLQGLNLNKGSLIIVDDSSTEFSNGENEEVDDLVLVDDSSTDFSDGDLKELDDPVCVEDSPMDFRDEDLQDSGDHYKVEKITEQNSHQEAKDQQKPLRKYPPKTGHLQRLDKG